MYRRPNLLLGLAQILLDCWQIHTQHCTRPFVVPQAIHAPYSQRLNTALPPRWGASENITNSRSRVSLVQLDVEYVIVELDSGFG